MKTLILIAVVLLIGCTSSRTACIHGGEYEMEKSVVVKKLGECR